MSDIEDDIDLRLSELDRKETECNERCLHRSSTRLANEIRRLAKAEQRLIPYIQATFTLMNQSHSLLQPEAGRDAAIEMIGLLESEERARSIQPDLPEDQYAHTVQWYSSCAYDNLAKNLAEIGGYNSEGMHACIADGLQVCRQTGKMQCITCFREYAGDVYRAADDLDMAMHFARGAIAHENPGPHDRRWAGARDLTHLLLLTGQLAAAAEPGEQAWELAETWHTPLSSKLETQLNLRELSLLLGEPDRWAEMAGSEPLEMPAAGEWPWLELRRDQVAAVAACCAQDFPAAIKLLTEWDRKLTRLMCLDLWFENRLRLLAALRLAGNEREFTKLADQLETQAQLVRDWLTLRCLAHLRDPAKRAAPVPQVAEMTSGPFAADPSGAPLPSSPVAQTAAAVEKPAAPRPSSEPSAFVNAFLERMKVSRMAAEDDPDAIDRADKELLADLLAIDPMAVAQVEDARWLLHLSRHVLGEGEQGREVWAWAEALAGRFPPDAAVLSLLGTLASAIRFGANEELADLVSEERIESLFRESLDLDPAAPRNFGRAGDYFRFVENVGEAERCYARGFRLNRGDAQLALQLANIYRHTERERDALAVLDMCLRAGGSDPELSWQAALLAQHLEQHDVTLTYLDAYDKLVPPQPWVNYYRSASLLALDRPAEALVAADAEAECNPDCPYHVAVHRAAAAGALGKRDDFRKRIAEVLATKMSEVEYLTPIGLCRLFGTLWKSAEAEIAADGKLRQALEDRVLAAGLAPNELFMPHREQDESPEGIHFYECVLLQPLDQRWAAWPGRLPHEEDWEQYIVRWGVLARSEEEAAKLALSWQKRSYPLAAEVLEVNLQIEDYPEPAGVVWQGFREPARE